MDATTIKTYLDAASWGAVSQPTVHADENTQRIIADAIVIKELAREKDRKWIGNHYAEKGTYQMVANVAAGVKEKLMDLLESFSPPATEYHEKFKIGSSFIERFNGRPCYRIIFEVNYHD